MANQYFYLDTNLATATKLYADMRGSTLGPSGYYSNSTIWRYWTGNYFSNNGDCNTSTNAPTPPPTSPPTSPPTPSPVTPPPTPAPGTPPPTPPPTPAPVTPAPATSPPTPPPTPNPTPSPATPSPTPAPVSAQSYQFYGCLGGGGLLDYDGNLNAGVVVLIAGFGCATIFSTSTSSPTYFGYSEYDSCADCTGTPSPTTPVPTPAPVTPAPTPAPTSNTCYRVQVTRNYPASYMVYAYTCCNGTYQNITSYNSTDYVCAINGVVNMYTGGSTSNLYIPCTGC